MFSKTECLLNFFYEECSFLLSSATQALHASRTSYLAMSDIKDVEQRLTNVLAISEVLRMHKIINFENIDFDATLYEKQSQIERTLKTIE